MILPLLPSSVLTTYHLSLLPWPLSCSWCFHSCSLSGYSAPTYSVKTEANLCHSPAHNLSQLPNTWIKAKVLAYKGLVWSDHWLSLFGPPCSVLQPCCPSHFSSIFPACSNLRVFVLTVPSAQMYTEHMLSLQLGLRQPIQATLSKTGLLQFLAHSISLLRYRFLHSFNHYPVL